MGANRGRRGGSISARRRDGKAKAQRASGEITRRSPARPTAARLFALRRAVDLHEHGDRLSDQNVDLVLLDRIDHPEQQTLENVAQA